MWYEFELEQRRESYPQQEAAERARLMREARVNFDRRNAREAARAAAPVAEAPRGTTFTTPSGRYFADAGDCAFWTRVELERAADLARRRAAFAERHGIPRATVADVLAGRVN